MDLEILNSDYEEWKDLEISSIDDFGQLNRIQVQQKLDAALIIYNWYSKIKHERRLNTSDSSIFAQELLTSSKTSLPVAQQGNPIIMENRPASWNIAEEALQQKVENWYSLPHNIARIRYLQFAFRRHRFRIICNRILNRNPVSGTYCETESEVDLDDSDFAHLDREMIEDIEDSDFEVHPSGECCCNLL
ncbi:hypothetical protein PCE1_000770 [Barthelona sp. PCE]